ncbi:formamidopyrimidine-DNA glycosylase [Methylomarinovum caldicuralii]|uniref:Formamidopyrimidine-DNA glycosylase n=1 Tax=Methylomarinovum caldicuralii TaxID=438856 RepID=A0AAU9CQR6_9GAMM|nr:bifunctional DNA-formamidopyrimidine glycosylase/DNA-(apurinic or apyrimidinic site) lyase [Methylomarinovum caldicuralii]BCX82298.1 formamidopyrimidine-DNA glycosylase [Methylomarinovum caldicuralii]
MPELPEVETTRRGLEPHLRGRRIVSVRVRQPRLRWPVADGLAGQVCGQTIRALQRRGKYLLLQLETGHLIVHLGMSGSLRLTDTATFGKHDHVIFTLDDGRSLVLRDPRRFGAVLWWPGPVEDHPLLRDLGPEPLSPDFDGAWLYRRSRGSRRAVKQFLMDQHVVAGIGNIYANEALFAAGIDPRRPAGRIGRRRYDCLAAAVKAVLERAIVQGGTTLRDFVNDKGQPGYFQLALQVYGREGQPCPRCHTPIERITLGQRATYLCPRCQR